MFYKSIPAGGIVTDLSLSQDGHWLAAIYSANGAGFVTVFSVDAQGDLTQVATSPAVGVPAFNGVALSQ